MTVAQPILKKIDQLFVRSHQIRIVINQRPVRTMVSPASSREHPQWRTWPWRKVCQSRVEAVERIDERRAEVGKLLGRTDPPCRVSPGDRLSSTPDIWRRGRARREYWSPTRLSLIRAHTTDPTTRRRDERVPHCRRSPTAPGPRTVSSLRTSERPVTGWPPSTTAPDSRGGGRLSS